MAQVISFNCLLKNRAGKIISTTVNRDVLTLAEDKNALLPGLVRGLQNLKAGDKRSIAVRAEEAYGLYDPKKIILFPRNLLPKNMSVGQTIAIVGKSGTRRTYRIADLHKNMVSLDGNHPLAGQDLVFEIETLSARAATREEINDAANVVSKQLLH